MDEPTKPRGRLRAAWQVLMGRHLVPFQIQAEWIEYKVSFDDIYTKLNAALARQSKLQKSLLDQITEVAPAPEEEPSDDRRSEVRRKAAVHAAKLRSKTNPAATAAAHLKILSSPTGTDDNP